MQRLRVAGTPEAVFARVRDRLRAIGATVVTADPPSISLVFDLDDSARGPTSRYFLGVVPADHGGSDIALARRRNDRRKDFRAMQVGTDDPMEIRVLKMLDPRVGPTT